jgi:hypothetical protein
MKAFFKPAQLLVLITLLSTNLALGQASYFFPKATSLDPKIPTPEQFLGYPVGTYFTRHDQVVAGFQIGYTFRVSVKHMNSENRSW